MLALGIPKEKVQDSIYLLDKYSVFVNRAKRRGYTHVIQADFLEWDLDMKFDVVIGNPPYSKRTWFKFVEKSFDLGASVVATINPDPTNNTSDFGRKWQKLCVDGGLVYRKNVTDHFPNVSSGRISSFVFDRNKKTNLDLLKSDSPIYDNILEKVTTKTPTSFVIRGKQEVSGYGDKQRVFSLKDTIDTEYKYPCILSCGKDGLKIRYSNRLAVSKKHSALFKGTFLIINRFFGKNNPDPVYQIDNIEQYNLGYDCLAFKLEAGENKENFISVYSSTLYRWIMSEMRNGGFDITQSNFMRFTRLDLTQSWSDEEIYKHFGLSQEEIDYVESMA
jgi:16S rRNA G966 N2-methylase RsmD